MAEAKETKKKEKTELQKTDVKNLQESMKPAPGTEAISKEDIILPRLRLLQDLSDEVKNQESKSGKLKHSLTEKIYDTIEFIPISMFKTRIMFDPANRNGAPLCRTTDMKVGSDGTACQECQNSKWTNGKPPACNVIYNYLMIMPEEVGVMIMPTVLSFMKISSQAATKLNTSVEFTLPRQPFWNKVWLLQPKLKHFSKGEAWLLTVQQVRDSSEKEREWAELIYNNTAGRRILDTEDVPAEDVPTDEL